MEKTISIRNTEVTFSIWDLGGQREFVNMLPLVCNDAVAILFMFDLTRKSTLNSIKEWYRQGRGFNKTAIPFLVGTKYDTFVSFPREEQEEISNQVWYASHGEDLRSLTRLAGQTLRQSHEGITHLLIHIAQHQCAEGTHSYRIDIGLFHANQRMRRSSRLCFQKHSTSDAPSPKSRMSESRLSCTRPFEQCYTSSTQAC